MDIDVDFSLGVDAAVKIQTEALIVSMLEEGVGNVLLPVIAPIQTERHRASKLNITQMLERYVEVSNIPQTELSLAVAIENMSQDVQEYWFNKFKEDEFTTVGMLRKLVESITDGDKTMTVSIINRLRIIFCAGEIWTPIIINSGRGLVMHRTRLRDNIQHQESLKEVELRIRRNDLRVRVGYIAYPPPKALNGGELYYSIPTDRVYYKTGWMRGEVGEAPLSPETLKKIKLYHARAITQATTYHIQPSLVHTFPVGRNTNIEATE